MTKRWRCDVCKRQFDEDRARPDGSHMVLDRWEMVKGAIRRAILKPCSGKAVAYYEVSEEELREILAGREKVREP